MDLPDWVVDEIRTLPAKYTGSIQIHCFEGGVGNITYSVSKKEPRDAVASGK